MVARVSAEVRIAQINAKAGCHFLGWIGEYRNNETRALCRCDHGHEWDATASSLVNAKSGCPECKKESIRRKNGLPESEYLSRLNQLSVGRFSVGKRVGPFSGTRTKYECKCCRDGFIWVANVSNLQLGKGCPSCTENGYRPGKPGSLYVLVSEEKGAVKVGISNNPDKRLKILARSTPFNWHQVAQVDSQDGAQIACWEKEIHSRHERAFDHSDFDGATEWLKTDRLHEILEDVTRMTAEAA